MKIRGDIIISNKNTVDAIAEIQELKNTPNKKVYSNFS